MSTGTTPIHEAADIFPLEEESIPELAADIKANGQQVPIDRLGGKVIDGRRRLRACELAKVAPKFRDIETGDPLAYVLSMNLHRRHLDKSQKSMVGARATDLRIKLQKEAERRMKSGKGPDGSGGRSHKANPVDTRPQGFESGATRDKIGELVGVSGRNIQRAATVLESGVPELVNAVDAGEITVGRAELIAKQPEAKQREEVAAAREQPARNRHAGEPEEVEDETNHKSRGEGVAVAHEAINLLSQIPKNDGLRKRGLQIVLEWVQRNLRKM
jgi:ParB-like chromosome segregation protein Spo0J